MKSVLAVALGGAAGSVLRYLVGLALVRSGFGALHWGTFAVNVSGALALGFLARYWGPPHATPTVFLLLTVGVCGGYTTFSTFTLDMFTMVERGSPGRAALYALASVCVSLAALALGYHFARSLRPLP